MALWRHQLKRFIPRGLVRGWSQFRGKVLLAKSLDNAYRETFFDFAFRALKFNGIDGDYVEFGCGQRTLGYAYHGSRENGHNAQLWGFDSFEGLPELKSKADEHPKWRPGQLATPIETFHKLARAAGIPRDAYTLVKGYYDDTIAHMGPSEGPTNIALAYIDCDLHSSTKTVLEFLAPRLKHGMILAFDDYFCWSATQLAGERRAAMEFFDNHERWRLAPYIQYGWGGASFVLEDKTL